MDLGTPSGSETGFRRPYLVIQNNLANDSRINTVMVCPLTSNLGRGDISGNVRLTRGEANLPQASVVVVSQVMHVDKRELHEFVGSLSVRRVRQVLNGIYGILEPREPVD